MHPDSVIAGQRSRSARDLEAAAIELVAIPVFASDAEAKVFRAQDDAILTQEVGNDG